MTGPRTGPRIGSLFSGVGAAALAHLVDAEAGAA